MTQPRQLLISSILVVRITMEVDMIHEICVIPVADTSILDSPVF